MLFPMYVDLTEKKILVAGAGTIAARRVRVLCEFCRHITVAAPQLSPEICELAEKYPICLLERCFEEADLEGKDLVFAATDDLEVNHRIIAACTERGILANNCSNLEDCDFQFPSVIRQGDIVIGLNASGKNHRLVKETRQRIEKMIRQGEEDAQKLESSSFYQEGSR